MNVLYLGPDSPATVEPVGFDWLVSRGYRHLLSREVLAHFPGRAINLHISLLPEHRGADPNFWSHVFATKAGVTIHAIDERLDTGPIYAQAEVAFSDDDTLRTSYDKLQRALDQLWNETWPRIQAGLQAVPQPPGGSYHRSADRLRLVHLMPQGWDTPIATLRAHASELQLSRALFANAQAARR